MELANNRLKVVRSAEGSVFIEPKYLEGKRADAQIYFISDISLMDVQVTHPAAPCYTISTNIAFLEIILVRKGLH